MSEYTPDNWVIIKLPQGYKVLAGWSGGYLGGDEWRLNSGIAHCEETPHAFLFHGHSGSMYICRKGAYGLRMNNAGIFNRMRSKLGEENCVLMPETTTWSDLAWNLDTE